jgi:NDP-sugar pyrophosphorylase family protein
MLLNYIQGQDFGIPVQVRVEETLLNTGGGIRNVADFWDEQPFVVINGDILTSIDLQEVLGNHERSGAAVTLVLTDEPRFNSVQVAEDGRILSFTKNSAPALAFTGIQVLEPQVVAGMPPDLPVSIIDCYQRMIANGDRVMSLVIREQFWQELGSPHGYLQVHRDLFHMQKEPLAGIRVGERPSLHPTTRLGTAVKLEGMVCIGAGSVLDGDNVIQSSVLWDRVRVRTGCSIRNSIVGDGVVVEESLDGAVVVDQDSSVWAKTP